MASLANEAAHVLAAWGEEEEPCVGAREAAPGAGVARAPEYTRLPYVAAIGHHGHRERLLERHELRIAVGINV